MHSTQTPVDCSLRKTCEPSYRSPRLTRINLKLVRGDLLSTRTILVLFAVAEVVDEHLFERFVIRPEDVADSVAADEVANFFSEVLGVIAGALESLSHKDDLQAALTGDVLGILDVAEEDEIAEAVN